MSVRLTLPRARPAGWNDIVQSCLSTALGEVCVEQPQEQPRVRTLGRPGSEPRVRPGWCDRVRRSVPRSMNSLQQKGRSNCMRLPQLLACTHTACCCMHVEITALDGAETCPCRCQLTFSLQHSFGKDLEASCT